MTTFLIVRHAITEILGQRLSGWMAGVQLSEEGRRQAAALAGRIAQLEIAALYSSPLERALETAAAIAERVQVPVRTCLDAGELRFGDWTGKSFDQLVREPGWQRFNSFRSGTRAPG